MTHDETRFFTLLDGYARSRHRCFVTEMFLWTVESGYYLCFRPLNVTSDSSARYACKYVVATPEEVRMASETGALPASLVEKLDADLSVLGQSI